MRVSRSLKCSAGGSLFVPAGVCSYRVRGTALLFRARVPLGGPVILKVQFSFGISTLHAIFE